MEIARVLRQGRVKPQRVEGFSLKTELSEDAAAEEIARLEKLGANAPGEVGPRLATTGPRSAGPRYSYALLQQHIDNLREGERIIFLNSSLAVERLRARAILVRAERLSKAAVDAAAGVWDDGLYYIVFRNRNVQRATAMEEFYHLAQWRRLGLVGWNHVPEPFASHGFTAFQYRELDAAVYLRNEFRAGRLFQAEYDETVANLVHHLRNHGDAVTIRRFLEGLP